MPYSRFAIAAGTTYPGQSFGRIVCNRQRTAFPPDLRHSGSGPPSAERTDLILMSHIVAAPCNDCKYTDCRRLSGGMFLPG